MAKDWSVRKRRPVRRKQVAPLLSKLEDRFGIDLNLEGAFLEVAEYGSWRLMIVNREPHAVEIENEEEAEVVRHGRFAVENAAYNNDGKKPPHKMQ